jgi:hypothetical protein
MIDKHDSSISMVRRFGRIKLVVAGLLFALVGTVRILNGIQIVTNWTGQPMFSWGLVAAGVVCILTALVPISWIAKATAKSMRERDSGKKTNL